MPVYRPKRPHLPLQEFVVPQCQWSYEELLAMPEDRLRELAADPKTANTIRHLLDFTVAVRNRTRMEQEAEEEANQDQYPIWDEHGFRQSTYLEYLLCPWWVGFRQKALVTANNKCQGCGATDGPFQVHHLHYLTLGMETLEDVQVLCNSCHEAAHGLTRSTPIPRFR